MIDIEDKITLVIHTSERAQLLKNILESHDIKVWLEDFVSYKSPLKVAQRVKICPRDLPLALKIMESGESLSPALVEMKMAGMSGNLLIPVDFSNSNMLAIKVGFELAKMLSLHPLVMHSYVAPLYTTENVAFDDPTGINDLEFAEDILNVREQAGKKLSDLKKDILHKQKDGSLPEIKFSTSLLEGVPEETILEYCKATPPVLVVMSTRGVDKKEEELIGSVTAEVLDSCRVPVFTVPENLEFNVDRNEIKRLILFCNMDQHDIMTIDQLMRMFEFPNWEIYLIPSSDRNAVRVKEKLDAMKEFFSANYPVSEFYVEIPDMKHFREDIDRIIAEKDINILIVPNKKTNVFSRIFRPTIAHKFLFERDMPMLAIPV